jgi:uncharacterized Zn finger protein
MQERPLLTKLSLQHFATERSYENGAAYYAEGAVGKVTRDGDTFNAYVQGTEMYKVRLRIFNGRVEKHCTCPYSKDSLCKHAVAVALAVMDGKYEATSPAPAQAPSAQPANAAPMLYEVENLLAKVDEKSKAAFLRELLAKNAELREMFVRFTTQYPSLAA